MGKPSEEVVRSMKAVATLLASGEVSSIGLDDGEAIVAMKVSTDEYAPDLLGGAAMLLLRSDDQDEIMGLSLVLIDAAETWFGQHRKPRQHNAFSKN